MKKLSWFLAFAMLLPVFLIGASVPVTAATKREFSVTAKAVNEPFTGGIVVYTAEDGAKKLPSMQYHFSGAQILVFNSEGTLIEAGSGLLETKGCCQENVIVPKGGFMIAFDSNANLTQVKQIAMENAMLYNATMPVVYPVKGVFDKATKTISISYDQPTNALDPEATRILFVGNSSTYFSGTPIQFKGLCLAAGLKVEVDYCTFGSAYLSEFANENHERGRTFRMKINSRKYDYIVFQDAVGADLAAGIAAMEILYPLAKENGATPVFYMRYSTYTDPEKLKARCDHFYEIYNGLTARYGGILAPSAISWYYNYRDYGIDLVADDDGHHTHAGAYVIACTWLYSILGVDPRGNSFVGTLSPEDAAHLQECALLACETPYVPNGTAPQRLRVGTTSLDNVAQNKPYTRTGAKPDNYTVIDQKLDGTPMGKLTDGVIAKRGTEHAIGAVASSEDDVVIDLGHYHDIYAFRTDLWADMTDIFDPASQSVVVSVSSDGKTYTEVGALPSEVATIENMNRTMFLLQLETPVGGRYVKLHYKTAEKEVRTSDIGVFGVEAEEPEPVEPSEEPEPENTGLPVGAIVGIVAAALAAIAAVTVVILKKKKSK